MASQQVVPSLNSGKAPPHREIFGLSTADLGAHPEVPPEVAEELLLLHEGHIAATALPGLLLAEAPAWITEEIARRAVRGLQALLKLLDASGYRVSTDVLREKERLAPLEVSFEEMRRYREAEHQEALKILEERRRHRGTA